MHIPNRLRSDLKGWDDIWLEKQLRLYFNKLDRCVFKVDHRRRGKRLKRVITLEKTATVGWHAHVSISTPPAIDQAWLIEQMHRLWHQHVGKDQTGKFEDKLFWAEPAQGNYVEYSFKYAFQKAGSGQTDRSAIFDPVNTNLN